MKCRFLHRGRSARLRLWTIGLLVISGAAGASAADDEAALQRLSTDIRVLASDLFEGRAPGTPGEERTIGWVAGQFMSMRGLEPGGDLRGATRQWTQAVPLNRSVIEGPVTSAFTINGARLTLMAGENFTVTPPQLASGSIELDLVPVLFAGYGVHAPEVNWNDFKGVDVRGKLLIVLVNDPDYETGAGDFGGKAMTWYGRWPYKFEQAAKLGAAGVLIVHETGPAGYGWNVWQYIHQSPSFDVLRERPADRHPLIEGYLHHDAAMELFRQAGRDFETEKRAAGQRGFRAWPLGDARFSVGLTARHDRIVTRNLVARLPGTERPDETVIYSAHHDHLGIGKPDASGDDIYNGAQDNASGTAMLLELARRHAQAGPAKRSIVFLALAAEESGLLGSEFYAANPLYPLATTAGVFNMDGMNLTGASRDAGAAGEGKVSLQDDLIAELERRGRTFLPESHPEAGYFYRSDHFPFAKAGVPALSFRAGVDKLEGGTDAGEAVYQEYVQRRYHQPADQWRDDFDLRGMLADMDVLDALGRSLANSTRWPEWKAGSEFKSVRDTSAAERR